MKPCDNNSRDGAIRVDIFDSLRGLLACWVLFVHVGALSGINLKVRGLLMIPALINKTGVHAVQVFMILSGFVIFYLIETRKEKFTVFIFRRFFRLFPVFLLCIFVGVLLSPTAEYVLEKVSWAEDDWMKNQLTGAQNDRIYALQHILPHLFMLHGIIPENILPHSDAAFSAPGWSISVEWQFYLIAPLLFMICRSTFGFLLFSIVVILAPHLSPLFTSINGGQPMRSILPTQIVWFYIGIVSFYYYREVTGFIRSDSRVVKITSVLVLTYLVFIIKYSYAMAVWFLFFTAVIFEMSRKKNTNSFILDFLHNPFFQYLGKISYPIYLFHWPIIILAIRLILLFNPTISHISTYYILLVTVPILTILSSHLVHYLIEQPCIDFARRILHTRMNA